MNIVIQKAISIAGSQKELAKRIGVDQSAVSKWLRGGGIRSEYLPGLIAATGGQLTINEIINSLKNKSLNSIASENQFASNQQSGTPHTQGGNRGE